MKKILILSTLCVLATACADAQSWLWAKQSTNDNTYGNATCTDVSGNVYVTGFYMNSVDFDGHTLTSTGGRDIYVSKYNSAGVLQWIQSAGCNKPNVLEGGSAIATDAAGNVYVTGDYGDSADFDGIIVTTTPAIIANPINSFIAKYNTDGVIQWVKTIGSAANGTATGTGIAVDGNGDVLTTGTFFGSSMVGTTTIGGCSSCSNVYVVKYNAAGDVVWAKGSDGAGFVINFGRSVGTDASNNVIIGGTMTDATSFEGTALSGFGGWDMFIVKYDASGSLIWAKQAGGTGTSDDLKKLTVSSSGDIYLGGVFGEAAAFGSLSLTGPTGGTDLFTAKMNAAGTFKWAKKSEATLGSLFYLTTDNSGALYATGMSLGGVFGGLNLPMGSYIIKYDNNGDPSASKMLPSFANSFGISVDPSGGIVSAGNITGGAAIFDGTTLSGNGFTTNMYVAKLDGLTTGVDEVSSGEALMVYPNPASSEVIIKNLTGNEARVYLIDITGRLVAAPVSDAGSGNLHLDISCVQNGVYLLQVKGSKGTHSSKLVIER